VSRKVHGLFYLNGASGLSHKRAAAVDEDEAGPFCRESGFFPARATAHFEETTMSDTGTVRPVKLTFGLPGTQTNIAAGVTSTSNPYPLPRGDYTVQVTVAATGTSGVGATVVWQGIE
jgi:hypothetical protein